MKSKANKKESDNAGWLRRRVRPLVNFMTKHEKHMKLIDDVNNAKTRHEHEIAYWMLHGWRKGMSDAGHEVDLCAADITQMERGHENRNMTCGIFHDWKPEGEVA